MKTETVMKKSSAILLLDFEHSYANEISYLNFVMFTVIGVVGFQ